MLKLTIYLSELDCSWKGVTTEDVNVYKDAIQNLESHAHDAAKILSLLNEILILNPSNPFIVVITNTVDHTNATIELKSTVKLDDTFSAINSSVTQVREFCLHSNSEY